MYTENLEQAILIKPAQAKKCNSLKIITGFTDIECITRHLIALADMDDLKKVSVEMILGMTDGNGLTEKKHKDILNLIKRQKSNKDKNPKNDIPTFICRYKFQGADIHSKVYIWSKDEKPVYAFCGSANYSMNAFHKRRECMDDCDASEALAYYNSLLSDTVLCDSEVVLKKVKLSKSKVKDAETDEFNLENISWDMFQGKTPIDTCKISLLTADGKGTGSGSGSGVNWGIRPERKNKDEAYIPYNKADRKDGFFPLRKSPEEKHNPIFKVVPRDFPPFFMRVAQSDDKGIQTAEDNSLLGLFLREKLNIKSGTFITKEMLESYGKTYVIFNKYEGDIYTLDF